MELNALTDGTLALSFAGELTGDEFQDRLDKIAALRCEVFALYDKLTYEELLLYTRLIKRGDKE